MGARMTYDEYKAKISIIDVAIELGYRLLPGEGKKYPVYVLMDTNRRIMDKIMISNADDNRRMGYFRHNMQRGDLIGFIRENLNGFPEIKDARNEIDAINRILARFSNMNFTADANRLQIRPSYVQEPFRIDRYIRELKNVSTASKYLDTRAISAETAELFSECYEIVKDLKSQYAYRNIAFPYTKAGTPYIQEKPETIVGYEIRGYGGFKTKAEGTDSSYGCWQAYLGKYKGTKNITEIHFAESALDIMAFVQINRHRLDLDTSLFVSVGGSFSAGQIRGLFNAYPGAVPVLHFDNDLNGNLYDCRIVALRSGTDISCRRIGKKGSEDEAIGILMNNKVYSFREEEICLRAFKKATGLSSDVVVQKAPGRNKDWNDVLINARNAGISCEKKENNILRGVETKHRFPKGFDRSVYPDAEENDNQDKEGIINSPPKRKF